MTNLKTYLYITAVLGLCLVAYLWDQHGQPVIVEVLIVLAFAALALLGFEFTQAD